MPFQRSSELELLKAMPPGEFQKAYDDEPGGMPALATRWGVSRGTIWYYFQKYNLSSKGRSLGRHLRIANNVNLSTEALEFLDGELLGDGSLYSRSDYSARFSEGTKYFLYARWLIEKLEMFGLSIIGSGLHAYDQGRGHYYQLATKDYIPLKGICSRWYQNGKKRVPHSLKLTPLVLRQWYLGDGCCSLNKHPYIQFATVGFLPHDRDLLINKLAELGLEATIWKRGDIYLRAQSTDKFFDLIGSCPHEIEACYGYKWMRTQGWDQHGLDL